MDAGHLHGPWSARLVTVAPGPVHLPQNQGVATAHVLQCSGELWPVHVRAGHVVNEDLGAARTLEGVDLKLRILVRSGDSGVAHQTRLITHLCLLYTSPSPRD